MELIKHIWNNTYDFFDNFFWNMRNIVRWIPVLWNAWPSDDMAVYRLITHQLRLAHDFFSKDSIVSDSAVVRSQISDALMYLDLWMNADEIAFRPFNQKYPHTTMEVFTDVDELGRVRHTFAPLSDEASALLKECQQRAVELNDYYKGEFFKIMSNYSERWYE